MRILFVLAILLPVILTICGCGFLSPNSYAEQSDATNGGVEYDSYPATITPYGSDGRNDRRPLAFSCNTPYYFPDILNRGGGQ